MREHETEFLVAEYEQAWAMILAIDERRFKFVEYYSAIFTAIVAVSAGVIAQRQEIDALIAFPLTLLLSVGVVVGLTFRAMLLSEREANVRYREKINLLRTVFLGKSGNPVLEDYITNHKQIGIKLISDDQPSGIGSTLKSVLAFLALETAVVAAAIPALWLAVLLG